MKLDMTYGIQTQSVFTFINCGRSEKGKKPKDQPMSVTVGVYLQKNT